MMRYNTTIIIFLLFLQSYAHSAQTVGELLNKISHDDRGGKSQMNNKSKVSVSGGKFNFEKSKVNLESVKPTKTSRYAGSDISERQQLENKIDEQIDELYKITKKFQNSSQRGELWLRLAELYVEKAELVDFRVYDKYEEKMKAFESGKGPKPKLNLTEARQYNKKSVQLYEWFQRDFPQDRKMDQVLFFLGYNYYELGMLKQGTDAYTRLTENFPRSNFITESQFALGEFYFENEKWDKALPYYLNVSKSKGHRLFTFALYKTAWCLYRTGKQKQALGVMEKLVRISQEERAGAKSKFKIDNEALKDLVVFFAEGGDVKKAEDFFSSLTKDNPTPYLEKLAYYYASKGYKEKAKYLFERLIENDNRNPKVYDYYYQMITLYSSDSKFAVFKTILYKWVRDFGVNSEWYQANSSNKTLIENSEKLRENTLRTYILQEHQTAQNSRAAFSQKNALEGYKLYFENFDSSPSSGELHFYYAELLYDMNRFSQAGDEYRTVVEKFPKSKFYEQAAINIVLSYEKALPTDEYLRKRVGNKTEKIEMEENVLSFIKAADWYLQKVPNGEKSVEIKFRQGRLYYLHNHFDEATQVFKEIVQKHPKSKYSEYSANLLLDIFNLRKDYAGLEKTGTELLAISSIANSKTGGEIKKVLEKATFKKAQDLEVQGNFKESATQFFKFGKENSASDLNQMAFYNAGINFERVNMFPQAIQSYNLVLNAKGEKAAKLKPTARRLVAKLYQDLGFFEEAADTYFYAAKDAGKDPVSTNLYYNAGILYAATGQLDKALEAYEFYIGQSQQADKYEAILLQAQILEKRKEYSRANSKYQVYITKTNNPKKQIEALYQIRKNNILTGSDNQKGINLQIERKYASLSSANKKSVAYMIASIKIEGLKEEYQNLRKINIPADSKAQKKAVEAKVALVLNIAKMGGVIIGYDSSDEVVDALTIIGQSNGHMYDALIQTPLPAGMNEEQKALYRQQVEKLAFPFKESAISSFKKAIEKSRSLESYPPSYQISLSEMKKLGAPVISDSGEKVLGHNYIHWMNL